MKSAIKGIGISNFCRIWPCQNITLELWRGMPPGLREGEEEWIDTIWWRATI